MSSQTQTPTSFAEISSTQQYEVSHGTHASCASTHTNGEAGQNTSGYSHRSTDNGLEVSASHGHTEFGGDDRQIAIPYKQN
ncbi:hypothetical protein I302_105415 [Kwoniella bestiolae CBS 10118]|uniref:Uncharacterized protein n=1 Tax=Kwoniella bestiolae CBS 10118 TaxID=1296100 RepID=A0A1B9FT19_9TREE|nr:hypothetical protein I302_08696 [Kwoniella bestiolae CBS 10118]OCF21917.1 hypothetical protein I302_08696 [Kwoniella bestiolae CBS 10118]